MIKCEYLRTRNDGVMLCKCYSDEGYMLLQKETGLKYFDPIDVADLIEGEYRPKYYTYEETDEKKEEIEGE